MNSSQLECFVAVAEYLNYAKAAEAVHLSQPAVTKKIQSLEEELDIRLLERDTRHVSLTYAGKQFYANAKNILLQEKNALATIAQLKAEKKRTMVIGTHNAEVYSYIGPILREVYEETRNMQPDIMDAPFQALNMSLNAQSVDIVIGTYEVMQVAGIRESAFHALAPSPVYCLTPHGPFEKDMPYALKMNDLDVDLIRKRLHVPQRITCYDLEQYYMQDRDWRNVVSRFANHTMVCDNMEAAMCMVEVGLGVLFMPVPDFLVKPERYCHIPIRDAHTMNYGYFYNKENQNHLLDLFRKKLEKYFDN